MKSLRLFVFVSLLVGVMSFGLWLEKAHSVPTKRSIATQIAGNEPAVFVQAMVAGINAVPNLTSGQKNALKNNILQRAISKSNHKAQGLKNEALEKIEELEVILNWDGNETLTQLKLQLYTPTPTPTPIPTNTATATATISPATP